MTYKIIGDSRLGLTEDTKRDPGFQVIPLILQIGSAQIVDGETLDQERFIEMVKACPKHPKTACPSPETFRAAFAKADAEAVFVITLSNHLSGSCNSAAVAKRLYEEEMAEKGMAEQAKKVTVIGSFSISSGEPNTALFTRNLRDPGLEFDEVVEETLAYRDGMNTYFVLESLGILRRNGRLSGLQAFFVTVLNVRPVIGADIETVIKLGQARGMNKALHRMCDIAIREVADAAGKITVVYHMDNPERAEHVESEPAKRVGFEKIVITSAAGMVTVYASDERTVLTV